MWKSGVGAHESKSTLLSRQSLLWLRGRTIGAVRAERHTSTSAEVNLVFRVSRVSLLARLPLGCSAECATPTNTSLLHFFRGIWPMPLSLLNHSALARRIGFCAIWVCISSSSSTFITCLQGSAPGRLRNPSENLSPSGQKSTG